MGRAEEMVGPHRSDSVHSSCDRSLRGVRLVLGTEDGYSHEEDPGGPCSGLGRVRDVSTDEAKLQVVLALWYRQQPAVSQGMYGGIYVGP